MCCSVFEKRRWPCLIIAQYDDGIQFESFKAKSVYFIHRTGIIACSFSDYFHQAKKPRLFGLLISVQLYPSFNLEHMEHEFDKSRIKTLPSAVFSLQKSEIRLAASVICSWGIVMTIRK